jgi:hypothetical protein
MVTDQSEWVKQSSKTTMKSKQGGIWHNELNRDCRAITEIRSDKLLW